jgi:transcriptional regulator with XRE-family HTH domain
LFSRYETLVKSAQAKTGRGARLRNLREDAGLTQVALARRLGGLKYYPFVSQVETGLSRVPTEKLESWARALHVRPSDFAKQLISFYEPELHRLFFKRRRASARRPVRAGDQPLGRRGGCLFSWAPPAFR